MIYLAITGSNNFHFRDLELKCLSFAETLDEHAFKLDTCSSNQSRIKE